MNKLDQIITRQKEFQRIAGVPFDSVLQSERIAAAEMYLFKTIEEVVELRKTFPSSMNKIAKDTPIIEKTALMGEFSDVILFLVNFFMTFDMKLEEVIENIFAVQTNNFLIQKEKNLKKVNHEILRVPGKVSGIGSGSLSPKYVFIGQNPGKNINHGYSTWSSDLDGSSKILLPILDALGIKDSCYFTNLVKSTTPNNKAPDAEEINFWGEFLAKELDILKWDNSNMKIVAMGRFVQKEFPNFDAAIDHPATVLYGTLSQEEYSLHIEKNLELTKQTCLPEKLF